MSWMSILRTMSQKFIGDYYEEFEYMGCWATEDKDGTVVCDCGKRFKSVSGWQSHVRSEHDK